MSAAEWIAKRRQLEQESRPSGYGLVPTNAVNRYHADTLRSLPLALNALEAALAKAQAYVDEYGDPVYNGNGYAEGVTAVSHEIIRAIESVLGGES